MSTINETKSVETTVETKKINLRDIAKRTDLFNIDPRLIKVDWDSNPREDYGDEDFEELKESIRNTGVEMPLFVYIDKVTNEVALAHGFRRMKAITQLIEEGVEITSVPIKNIPNNSENILAYHLTLNNGKALSEIEVAKTLLQMYNLMGQDFNAVHKKANMDYQKVNKLINFMLTASTKTIAMVKNKEISISNAYAVAKQANGIEHQNEILEEAKKKSQANGSKKIKASDISEKIKTPQSAQSTARKREDVVKDLQGFVNFLKSTGVQQIAVEDLQTTIDAMSTGASIDELIDTYMTK